MAILRLIIYQPQAHYRIPFTTQRRHTYPIPPYSTVIGFLCNVCGIKDQKNEFYENVIKELKFSIIGKFNSKITEMIWFRNLNKENHIGSFDDISIREKNGNVCHPGGQIPINIDILEEVEIMVHIYNKDKNKLEKLKQHLENPICRLQPLHLGRAEDWIVFKDISILDDNLIEYKRQDGRYPYFCWIPENIYTIKNEYEINWKDFDGALYRIPTFSQIENYEKHYNHTGRRIYKIIHTKLNKGLIINTKCLFDAELNTPIFLGDLK